jgi:large subunit ribosomal protein L23
MAEKKEHAHKEEHEKEEAKHVAKKEHKAEHKKKPTKEDAAKKHYHKPAKEKKIEIEKATDADVARAFDTIKFVLMTEKSVRIVEAQNKLVFITRRNAHRDEIKRAVEAAFGSPVTKVTTMIDQDGRKKAFVKFRNEGAAGDIAIKLGII